MQGCARHPSGVGSTHPKELIVNANARAFFDQHPDEPYWYYSPTLRVPNPRVKPWLFVPRTPWPPTIPVTQSAWERA